MFRLVLILSSLLFIMASCGSPRSVSSSRHKPKSHASTKAPQKKPTTSRTESGNSESAANRLQKNHSGYLKADGLTRNKEMSHLINDWLGVPHKMGGKTKSGVDCSGFTSIIMNEIYNIDFRGPSAVMATKTKPIAKERLQEGDLVFFKIGGTKVSHVGVYLDQGYFAHATLQRGVMISSLAEPYYSKYFYRAGRIN